MPKCYHCSRHFEKGVELYDHIIEGCLGETEETTMHRHLKESQDALQRIKVVLALGFVVVLVLVLMLVIVK